MVVEVYGSELRFTDIFAIDKGDGKGQARWETLSKRVTEHVFTEQMGFLLTIEHPSNSKVFHSNQNGSTKYLSRSL